MTLTLLRLLRQSNSLIENLVCLTIFALENKTRVNGLLLIVSLALNLSDPDKKPQIVLRGNQSHKWLYHSFTAVCDSVHMIEYLSSYEFLLGTFIMNLSCGFGCPAVSYRMLAVETIYC